MKRFLVGRSAPTLLPTQQRRSALHTERIHTFPIHMYRRHRRAVRLVRGTHTRRKTRSIARRPGGEMKRRSIEATAAQRRLLFEPTVTFMREWPPTRGYIFMLSYTVPSVLRASALYPRKLVRDRLRSPPRRDEDKPSRLRASRSEEKIQFCDREFSIKKLSSGDTTSPSLPGALVPPRGLVKMGSALICAYGRLSLQSFFSSFSSTTSSRGMTSEDQRVSHW